LNDLLKSPNNKVSESNVLHDNNSLRFQNKTLTNTTLLLVVVLIVSNNEVIPIKYPAYDVRGVERGDTVMATLYDMGTPMARSIPSKIR